MMYASYMLWHYFFFIQYANNAWFVLYPSTQNHFSAANMKSVNMVVYSDLI